MEDESHWVGERVEREEGFEGRRRRERDEKHSSDDASFFFFLSQKNCFFIQYVHPPFCRGGCCEVRGSPAANP